MERTIPCSHISILKEIKVAKHNYCQECIKEKTYWVHLRTCQTCGVTLCCDSSPQKHMTGHTHHSGHPVISSAEPGERWVYCFKDDQVSYY